MTAGARPVLRWAGTIPYTVDTTATDTMEDTMHHTTNTITNQATPLAEGYSHTTIDLHNGDTAPIAGTTKAHYIGPGHVHYLIAPDGMIQDDATPNTRIART